MSNICRDIKELTQNAQGDVFMNEVNTINESIRMFDFEKLKTHFKLGTLEKAYKLPNFEETIKVKNQDCYGACVAFATSIILEYINFVETGEYTELSPGYIYGKHRGEKSTSYGMSYSDLCDGLLNYGSVPMSIFSRMAEMPEMKKIIKARPDLDEYAKPYRIKGFAKINSANKKQKIQDMQQALVNTGYPLLVIMQAHTASTHAICVYGWEKDNTGNVRFLYQNSYGESWGTNGRHYIYPDDMDVVICFLDYVPTVPFADVKIENWFYKNVLHMYNTGLMSGKSADKFDPNGTLTRAEIAAIIDRLMKKIDEKDNSTALSIEDRLKRIEEKLNLV